ncbi:sulfatase family protein [Flavilitoribacter nigricans]|uniref:Arylsulfatase n=1 Tax=Flavilitoribacter nigricans (strain ATCC 23147 / DSM 23189 / NBRC 102662 / NCIMB 1420 / SS-2) TaxID=1122177 RepID=A0A2D0N7R1_FLAN2|nr:arylsulfatase [Flavilitoribacter nigricans]PHN04552.1 arylsulfatase [Flavilitoribacter nigricans DSM 23189 = NBRC 102662]
MSGKKVFCVLPVIGAICLFFACGQAPPESSSGSEPLPNIVLIYVDDLGYGDVGAYGASGVSTPNIDFLAQNGLRFTDAHCSAATCTPSRYALLTGRYAFRKEAAVLPGNAPLLIDTATSTLAGMLKGAGYTTGVVGKWHLGLGDGFLDWNQAIKPGPLELGFDYSFLIPSTGDRVPSVYVENHRVVNLNADDPITVSYRQPVGDRPTGDTHPELRRMVADPQHNKTIVNGISRIGYMEGGESALWTDEEFPDILNGKAGNFIAENRDQPFFLYYSFHDIHVPRLPNPRFVGKSSMGPRGDAIVQTDWMTGQIIKKLDALGLSENTIILFTSDNGPVLNDGYEDQAVELLGDHQPAGPYRGGKYSAYEAGTRVPMIAYWPGTIKAGTSNALFGQIDIYASLAGLAGQQLSREEAIDSKDHLPVLLGKAQSGREMLVEESLTISLREGNWKYIRPFGKNDPAWITEKGIEGGFRVEPQLYQLQDDPGETNNLADQFPERIQAMEAKIQEIEARAKRPDMAMK